MTELRDTADGEDRPGAPAAGPSDGPQAPAAAWRPGTGRPGGVAVGWTELLMAIPVYLVLSGVAGIALFLVGGLAVLTDAVPVLAVTGVATLVSVAVVLVIRVRWLPAIGLRRTTTRMLLAGVAAGLLMRGVAVVIGWVYPYLFEDLPNPQVFLGESLAGGGPLTLAGVLLAGALLVPFAEELLFRGICYGALRRYGVWVAVTGSSVLFALAHGLNVVTAVALVLGVLCALLYERSRSVWPAVVTHAVFNASGFVLVTFVQ